jgi:hypothetical protein
MMVEEILSVKNSGKLIEIPIEAMEKAEQLFEGSSEIILKAWYEQQSSLSFIKFEELKLNAKKYDSHHKFRQSGLIYGTLLALSALALGAFGIINKAELLSLAALITPIAGLAGVFIWGYQRRD